jgi:hypothetical protein
MRRADQARMAYRSRKHRNARLRSLDVSEQGQGTEHNVIPRNGVREMSLWTRHIELASRTQ